MKLFEINRCDIFCAVVDNFGDIGVSWRLARQLANEHQLSVRIWVDDLSSFHRLCSAVDSTLPVQVCRNVEIRHWQAAFPEVEPAQLVIEAFACELPERYVLAMAEQEIKPVWINLEYLSAEDWVESCHGLPSPHPQLPLVKYFFFPGFTGKTGGLLLENDLLRKRAEFLPDMDKQQQACRMFGIPARQANELWVSLFSYENPAMHALLSSWSESAEQVVCLIPEGRAIPQVAAFFEREQLFAGERVSRGNLRVHVVPFVEQEEYDKLLWLCDINFVRGEDSCVRAQWAGKPFIWHIYPQHDGVHMEKLQALLIKYTEGLTFEVASSVTALWKLWNMGKVEDLPELPEIKHIWSNFAGYRSEILHHGEEWISRLSANNLALNLLDFSHKVGKMRPFEN